MNAINGSLFISAVLILTRAAPTLAVEEAAYTVLEVDGDIEVRAYEPHIVAETLVESEMVGAGNQGFRVLYRYITGHNVARDKLDATAGLAQEESGNKIPMTAPVGQEQVGQKWSITFMMPSEYTLENLPEPKDPSVKLREVPARTMAAVNYSGFWSEANYERNKNRLERWLDEREIAILGKPVWARYDSPFTLWFMRRNEVLIPVNLPETDDQTPQE